MLSGLQLWRLGEAGPDSLGLHCGQDGLFLLTAPGWTPRQEDLDRLDAAIRSAAIRRVLDKIPSRGAPTGAARRLQVRELPGGLAAARALFDYLRVGGQVIEKPDLEGTLVRLPGNAGYVTLRPRSTSGPPAVDINIPDLVLVRIRFP